MPRPPAIGRSSVRVTSWAPTWWRVSSTRSNRPTADETDIISVDGTRHVDEIVAEAVRRLSTTASGTSAVPLLADGAADRAITADELAQHMALLAQNHVLAAGARRVLLVPPDHTRLHSQSGPITVLLKRELEARGCTVGVLPALGTHLAMTDMDAAAMFGDEIDAADLLVHDWRHGLKVLGEIGGDEVSVVTAGRYIEPIPVAVDAQLFDGWDLVISIGQVVPHEVIGMANFTKNVVIGLGGAPTIHRSHFVGAVAGMEQIMGRTASAVRDVVDAAFDRFVEPLVPVLWVLTVVEDVDGSMVQRGLYVGDGRHDAFGRRRIPGRRRTRPGHEHRHRRRAARSRGVLARPGRDAQHLAGQQGRVPHQDGDRRRWRTDRARTRRHPFRRGSARSTR